MFICKSKKLLQSYYNEIFPWLENCEKLFGFESLKGYGMKRIYGFLAERYLSYWFQKNTKYTKHIKQNIYEMVVLINHLFLILTLIGQEILYQLIWF